MRPYDAPSGTVWIYKPENVPDESSLGNPTIVGDEEIVLVYDGYCKKNEQSDRYFRNAFALLAGVPMPFTRDSLINEYSELLYGGT